MMMISISKPPAKNQENCLNKEHFEKVINYCMGVRSRGSKLLKLRTLIMIWMDSKMLVTKNETLLERWHLHLKIFFNP